MKIFYGFVAFVVLLAALGGLVFVYSPPVVGKMSFQAGLALGEFLQRSKAHDYTGAHQMLSRRLQNQISTQNLAQQWKAFEAAHGPIRNWTGAPGGSISLWPRYVDDNHTLLGQKNGSGLITTRIVPEGKNWRIDQLNIKP